MRRGICITAALAALAAGAMDPRMIMPRGGDPSAVPPPVMVSNANCIATFFVPEDTEAYTLHVWHRTLGSDEWRWVGVMLSAMAARATREGGEEIPAVREYAPIALSGGTWSMSGLPQYEVPEMLAGGVWDYGCYCVNILTPTPVTLVVAGTEKQVPPSDKMQIFNILGSAADRSVTLAAADAAAAIDFGIGVANLIEFKGDLVGGRTYDEMGGKESFSVSNTLVCTQLKVWTSGGKFCWSRRVRRTDGGSDIGQAETNSMAVAVANIKKDARIGIVWYASGGSEYPATEVYGARYEGRLLDDWELDRVFDVDLAEIRRRHIMGE